MQQEHTTCMCIFALRFQTIISVEAIVHPPMMASSSREKERLLQPVYNALERRNYNRAIKLCSEKQISTWPIAIGLRAHAWERSGRSDEAIRTVEEELLPRNDWEECESTITIVAMTLKSCRHYNTLAQLYSRAVDAGERQRSPPSPDLRALHHNNLVGLFTAQLRLALQTSNQQPQQQNLREGWMTLTLNLSPTQIQRSASDVTASHPITSRHRDSIQFIGNCYETMQATAMKLARGFGSSSGNIDGGANNIYWSWTVFSILLHCEALQHLLLLQTLSASSPEQIHLLRQKSEMLLPKLAENLFRTKLLSNKLNVSGEEWKLYVRSLLAQSRYSDALNVLEQEMTPFPNDNSSSNTIFQMSERERMVLLIKVSFLAKEFATSMQYCRRQLTEDSQPQWSCFMALLTNNISLHHFEKHQEINWKGCEDLFQMEYRSDDSAPSSDLNMNTKIYHESNERRSKSLFMVQLAATKLSHSSSTSSFPSLLLQFQNSILDYISDFALDASCVFLDMKPFLKVWSTDNAILAHFTTRENEHGGKIFIKTICSLRCENEDTRQQQGDAIEPHRFLRRYTTVCQIICFLQQRFLTLYADKEKNDKIEKKVAFNFIQVIEQHGPKIEEMLKEWKNRSLSTTALVYKEGRIGDELVLCVAKILVQEALFSSSSRCHSIQLILIAVGILEYALIQSPYCSSCALMLIQLHNLLGSSFRSLQLFSSLDIKQVQVESMSHLILNSCSSAGAFGEISKRCGEILQLHRSAANSVCDYAMEALQKGNYTAAIDMIKFQTHKMNPSVQLLHAKAMIMDLAPLLAFHRNPISGPTSLAKQMPVHLIGSIQGLVGDDVTDEIRALEMLDHSTDRHSATSIIVECLEVVEDCVTACLDGAYSDNRDLEVCPLDLSPTISTAKAISDISRMAFFPCKTDLIFSSLSVGHVHSILVRTTIAISAIKPFTNVSRKKKLISQSNKKKEMKSLTTKEESNDATVVKQQIQGLREAVEGAKTFFSCMFVRNSFLFVSESAAASNALLRAFLYLSEFLLTTCELTMDNASSTSAGTPNNCHLIKQAREQIDASASSLMLRSNLFLEEGRIFLIDPMNLSTVGNIIPQRLVALFATLHNLKRVIFSVVHRTSASKQSVIEFESDYNGLISSCIRFVDLLEKALASESPEIVEAVSVSKVLSCVPTNSELTEFLQSSYLSAATLVSNFQDESRRVIKSILAELSSCCLELQV